MKRLDETLATLSEQQLRLLSRWLGQDERGKAAGGRKQICAYVVTAPGSPDGHLSGSGIRAYLAERLPEHMIPDQFEFVGSLPRLPNGKLDRSRLSRLKPALSPVDGPDAGGDAAPGDATEQILAEIWSEALQVEPIGIHDNYFELGGDSIVSIQIISKAREQGLALSHQHFGPDATIAAMAAALRVESPAQSDHPMPEQRTGEAAPTPIQQWFLERDLSRPAHWNSARCFELTHPISAALVRPAVLACLNHHDGLRACFAQSGDGRAICRIDDGLPEERVFHQLAETSDEIEINRVLDSIQQQFSLSGGPLIAFALRPASAQAPARLYIIANHLLVDNVSWQILAEDLETALCQLRDGEPVKLPARTTSLLDWSKQAARFADSEACRRSLPYWQDAATDTTIPCDYPLTDWPREQSVQFVQSTPGRDISRQLTGTALQAYNAQVRDLLISALALTLSCWSGNSRVQLDLEGHGREAFDPQLDIGRTVGWFTSFFPFQLTLPENRQPGEVIKSVKEALRRLPGNGNHFGMLRYLSGDESTRQSLAACQNGQVLFNYLGRNRTDATDGILKPLPWHGTALRAAENTRSHLIEINAEIAADGLVSTWLYSSAVHQRDTVATLAADFDKHLSALIEHCQSPDAGGYTLSDFPEAGLDQDDLDNLLESL